MQGGGGNQASGESDAQESNAEERISISLLVLTLNELSLSLFGIFSASVDIWVRAKGKTGVGRVHYPSSSEGWLAGVPIFSFFFSFYAHVYISRGVGVLACVHGYGICLFSNFFFFFFFVFFFVHHVRGV